MIHQRRRQPARRVVYVSRDAAARGRIGPPGDSTVDIGKGVCNLDLACLDLDDIDPALVLEIERGGRRLEHGDESPSPTWISREARLPPSRLTLVTTSLAWMSRPRSMTPKARTTRIGSRRANSSKRCPRSFEPPAIRPGSNPLSFFRTYVMVVNPLSGIESRQ